MDYRKVYDRIIEKARNESRSKAQKEDLNYIYYEAHHIIPVCMGGSGSKLDWQWHSNIVLLTAREHFICHWLLARIYPTHVGVVSAFWMMCQRGTKGQSRYRPSSRAFQEAREAKARANTTKEVIEKIRVKLKGRVSPTKGKKRTAEQVQKSVATRKKNGNNYISEETKLKAVMTRRARGSYIFTQEHIEKLKGTRGSQAKAVCPYCSKVGGIGGMKRYHFNRCKLK
jgi:hypothetical protein